MAQQLSSRLMLAAVFRPRVVTPGSVRKALSLAIGNGLCGIAVFCAGYATWLLLQHQGMSCSSLGLLLIAAHAGVLGAATIEAAQRLPG